jgi:PEP-CTERM motif
MTRLVAASLIALLLVVGFAVRVHAGPISGSLTGDGTLAPTDTPGIFIQSYTGEGNDTTYGPFTVQTTSTVDLSHPPDIVVSDGVFTQTFSLGTLFGTSSGEGTISGTGTATFTGDAVITGGTGIFEGATGEIISPQMLIRTSPTTTSGSGTYVGVLSLVPEPSSLALLASGALVLLYRRRRGTMVS